MDNNHKIYVAVCIENICTTACFTILAILFNKWWIILFAILMHTSVRSKNSEG